MLLLFCQIAFSQNKITGKIIDEASNQPLQGATITDLQNNKQVITDKEGQFFLSHESDNFEITCIGYQTIKKIFTPGDYTIYLSPSFSNLNEIVISGSREIQKRTEVPVAINIISKSQMNDTKATRLDMLINKVPGVFMVDLGNEQHSMSVRQPLGYSNLFLYLEDGIPIRALGDFNHNALIEINQSSLQRIEVIKGPASSLYGSEAVGGAINFITASPSPTLTGKVQAEVGTSGYYRTDFTISNTHKKLGIFFGGYYADQQQKITEHNNFNKLALTLRGDYHFNDKTKLVTVADLIQYQTDQKGGLDSVHFYNKDYTSFYRFTYRKVNAFRMRTTLNKDWNKNSKTNFTLFYRNTSIGQNPFYSLGNLPNNPLKATGQINKDAFNSYGALVQHSQKFEALNTTWISGASVDYSPATFNAQFINVDKDAQGVYYRYQKTDSLLTDYKVDLLNSAIYTQLQIDPIKNLRVVLAIRYDRLDYRFDNHLPPSAYTGAPDATNHFDQITPKVGFTYNFKNNRGVYVNYSVGFAPPNISDLYTGVKVPSLQPASYKNYEIGGWYGFDTNKGYAEISLYQLDGKNEIISVRLPDGTYINQNAGITSHKGVELNVKYAPIESLNFRLGGTVAKHTYVNFIQQGKDFSNNEMPQSPSYIMNGEVIYKPLYLQGFRISLEFQSMGAYFTDPQNTSKYNGFTFFNARAGYQIKNWEAWINALNITNNNYAVTVEKSAYGTSYRPGQLQTFQIGMSYHL
jgi:outer membrane receptor protein involved in Fe transport